MKNTDAAWLAGLFEGEGWFRITQTGGVQVGIGMCDRDVIDRVATLVPCLKIGIQAKPNCQVQYVWAVYGATQVTAFIKLVGPYLGSRRTAKAQEVLASIASRPERRKHFNREKTHCVRGHEYTTDSTYVDREGYRSCRICRRAQLAAYRARQS